MEIYHITNINCAIQIINQKEFIPISTNPLNGDAGINLLGSTDNFNKRQCFEKSGCDIIFSSNEQPINISSDESLNNMKLNTLYSQPPWRLFIRYPLTKDVLRIVSIRYNDYNALEDYVLSNYIGRSVKKRLLNFLKIRTISFYVEEFKNEIQNKLDTEEVYIRMS